MATSIDLNYLVSSLESDSTHREQVREATRALERDVAVCTSMLNRIHTVDKLNTPALLESLAVVLPAVRESISKLAAIIPPSLYYRYNFMFNQSIQSASYIVVLRDYLLKDELATKEEVEKELGIVAEWSDHFELTTEDYLHSIISLLNELSRLAVNRVTLGDFESPASFAQFAKELSSGFGLLNLKNDSLRKRFDGIKYDVKKLEEIVYDLSLRGLLKSSPVADVEGQGPTKRVRTE